MQGTAATLHPDARLGIIRRQSENAFYFCDAFTCRQERP
jgi:hypothetical protein